MSGGGGQDVGVSSVEAIGGCHHLSANSSSPPGTSCGVGDRRDQGVTRPEPYQKPQDRWEEIRTFFLLTEILRSSAPSTVPDWHRGCHQCHELAILCGQSLQGLCLQEAVSDCTLGIHTDPLGCSWPPGRGTAEKGAYTTPLLLHLAQVCCGAWQRPLSLSPSPAGMGQGGRIPPG